MSKRGGNHPIPGHFKVQGAPIEGRDATRASKQALGRQEARKKRRAGRKTRLGVAPPEQRAKEPPKPKMPASASVEAVAHDRDFARMNERRPPRRLHGSDGTDEIVQPRYLSETVRGVARRVARVALAPLSLARAVVDRFRKHE